MAYSRYVELEYEGDVIKLGKLDPNKLRKKVGALVSFVVIDGWFMVGFCGDFMVGFCGGLVIGR